MTSEQIFKKLGIENSSDEFKAKMISKIMATADLRFARVVDDIMSDEDRAEFEAFSEGKSPEEIAQWVEGKYEGIGDMYAEIIASIVEDLERTSKQV